MMPTMPAGGSVNDRSSMRRRSPKPLLRFSTSITWSPRRRPAGIVICSFGVALLGGLGLGVQLLVGVEAGLALRLTCLRAHAHPFELASEGLLACLVAALFARQAVVLLLEPARVVAFEGHPLASFQLEDPLGHVVEEVPVVGDRHDGARVVAEEPFEPVDRLGVEVVGRFVEQQQVGAAEQQAAQGDTAALATGEHGHVGVVGWAAQRVHGDVDVAFERPGVGGGDLVFEDRLLLADLVVVGVGVGPLGHDLVVVVDDALHLGDAVHDVAP